MDNNQNNNNQNPNNQNNNQKQTPRRPKQNIFNSFGMYILIIILLIGTWFAYRKLTATNYETVTYEEISQAISDNRFISGSAKPNGSDNNFSVTIKGTYYEDAEKTKIVYYKVVLTDLQYELISSSASIEYNTIYFHMSL